jgi:hypothetical protein
VKRLFVAAAALVCACWPAMVRGELIVSVDSKDVNYSSSDQTGWLYVYLQSTESPQPKLKSFDLRLNLSGDPGFTFLDAQEPPGTGTLSYVLPGGAAYTVTMDSPTQITVSDIVLNSGNDVVDGRAFVQFECKVAGGTPIGAKGHVNIDTTYTDLFAAVGTYDSQQLPFTPHNGAITVIPEPGSLALLGVGMIAVAFCCVRRRLPV